MPINTLDGIVAAPRQTKSFFKFGQTAKAGGTFQSTWKAAGLPSTGVTPTTTPEVCDNTTVGALFYTPSTSGLTTYLTKLSMTAQTAGCPILYDRLVHSGGLNGTLTTDQAVNTPALTRYTDGVGVEIFLEVYTATGATASNVTVTYTNSDGVSGRVSASTAMQVTPVIGQMIAIPLAAGDKGVKSVQSVKLSASTGTAGNFGVTLVKRIVSVPCPLANNGQTLDPFALGLPEIQEASTSSGACLAIMVNASTTSTGTLFGEMVLSSG
jgi:hypothetical protein